MSAQSYTVKVRVLTEARNNKVQQAGNIASINTLEPCACVIPNYSYIKYVLPPYCGGIKPQCLKQ